MEVEAKEWIERYPVPVMVSASDDKDDVIHVGESIEDSHFTAWRTPDGQIEEHWRPLKDSELPSDALSIDYLLTVYEDVLYQTREEVRKQADDWARERLLQKRITMFGLVAWGVVAPITIIILEKRLAWAGRLATLYASYKAGKYAIQLFGLKKTSRREMEKRDKEQRMKEYYYHCKKNPEGFLRLKAENVTRDERERTARTVEKLKRNEGKCCCD